MRSRSSVCLRGRVCPLCENTPRRQEYGVDEPSGLSGTFSASRLAVAVKETDVVEVCEVEG